MSENEYEIFRPHQGEWWLCRRIRPLDGSSYLVKHAVFDTRQDAGQAARALSAQASER